MEVEQKSTTNADKSVESFLNTKTVGNEAYQHRLESAGFLGVVLGTAGQTYVFFSESAPIIRERNTLDHP